MVAPVSSSEIWLEAWWVGKVMQPDVLYLILCNDVRPDPTNYQRLHVLGLLTSIRSGAHPRFPLVQPSFSVLVILTGGQGSGELVVRIIRDPMGAVVFKTRPRQVRFVGDPMALLGMRFLIKNCTFPAAGLYWVEVVYTGSVLARQRLYVKS
jgi:hypothetical protein